MRWAVHWQSSSDLIKRDLLELGDVFDSKDAAVAFASNRARETARDVLIQGITLSTEVSMLRRMAGGVPKDQWLKVTPSGEVATTRPFGL